VRHLGLLYWAWGAAAVVLLAVLLQMACFWLAQHYGLWLALPLLALLLKPLFAWRMLAAEVQAVEAALAQSLGAGRARLAYLVSRDTSALSEAQVREAAIETLAENFNDSFIAPLFWFALGGLPAAALYRYANTADASWGYIGLRSGREWTDAGRFAARTDDVLSYLPARLTAALFLIAAQAGFTRKNAKNTLRNLHQEAGKTPSPNSGWPMAAMALLLHLRLGKPGVYQLNPQGDLPQAPHLQAALRLCRHAWLSLIWALTLAGVFLLAAERGFFYT
jgi:adenosylcobinamide-phosphate synthase